MKLQDVFDILVSISEQLDDLLETTVVQNNEDLRWELGEAVGYVDNAISVLEDLGIN